MKSLRIFWIFCLVVFILITTALLFKVIVVVYKSKFDGQHRFTLLITKKPIRVVSISPETKSLSVLTVTDIGSITMKDLEKVLAVPIDGQIISKKNIFPKDASVEYLFEQIFFQLPQMQTEITYIDALRMWLFARGVDTHAISSETITVKNTPVSVIDKTMNKLFSDSAITGENISIEIYNGTGVEGMGSNLARQLTNIGGNVVAVSTATRNSEETKISYYENKSYTVRKLEQLLHTKAELLKKKGISDIIVVLGKDSLR